MSQVLPSEPTKRERWRSRQTAAPRNRQGRRQCRRCHAPDRAILGPDFQHHRRHRRDRLPDQSAGAQRGRRAARAGEAGRGFAVVAQEVRELASGLQSRKGDQGSDQQFHHEVESGVKLVRETGEVLKTIEQYIITINHHMDAIATSAREQSTGLAEVNTAVNQMDQVTQQNAAMVEETNAASASLATEAGRLRELISQFNLGRVKDAGRHRPPQRSQDCCFEGAPVQASHDHRPVVSPARKMAAMCPSLCNPAAAAKESWEEF